MTYFPAQSREQYFRNYIKPSGPSDDPVCPICFEDWNPDTSTIVQTMCSHTFHRFCLAKWLYGIGNEVCPNTCPSCRAVCFPRHSEQEAHNVNHVLDPGLGADSNYASDNVFEAMARHIEGIVAPLLELEEVYARFGIDLECSDEPSRFLQAMKQVISAGVALSRIPLNLHEGWMPMLAPHLNDWLTVKFLVASLFVTTQWPLMTPDQWTDVLAARNRIGRAAFYSTDFGSSTVVAWLEHINDRHDAQYEVLISGYFPNTTFARWKETNTAGRVVNEGYRDCTITNTNSMTYINILGTDLSPGPVLYFQGNSLWISERVIGNIVRFRIDEDSRTVVVRSSANHTFKVEFFQRELREDCGFL